MSGSARGVESNTVARKSAQLVIVYDERRQEVVVTGNNIFKNTPEGRINAADLVKKIRTRKGWPQVDYVMKAI